MTMNLTKILAGLLLVLAVALAIGAWLLGRQPARAVAPVAVPQAANSAPSTQPAAVAQHAVVVAAKPLSAGQRLTAEDVKLVQLPVPVASSFAATADVLGRTTTVSLAEGGPLFEQQLISGLALQLESGQRAVSVAVKETMAVGHHVRPGDFVDVFFTMDGRSGAEGVNVDTQTRLLLARSRVLAYGASSVENPPLTDAQRQQQEQEASKSSALSSGSTRRSTDNQAARQVAANTAVLAVPLDDVQRITLAEKFGQLTVALRHPDDLSVPDPALFAALPTVLQPVAGSLKKGESLQDADRAFAGLRFKDLAAGGNARNTSAQRSTAPKSATTAAPRPRTLEVYQGSAAQQVRY